MERIDKVTLQIAVKSQADRRELNDLNDEIKESSKSVGKLQRELDKLNSKKPLSEQAEGYQRWREKVDDTTRALAEEQARLSKLERQKNVMINQMGVERLTLREVREEMKQYKMLLDNLDPKSEEYAQTLAYYQSLRDRLREVNSTVQQTQGSLSTFLDGWNKATFAVGSFLALKDRVVGWSEQYVDAFASIDEAMTDVMKYTGQTKAEVEQMNETFKRMQTRTSREELNALAGAAGRLGIQGRAEIEGFVDAADKINVALGDDLGQGAIDQIGKLTMVFGDDKTKGLNGAMLATGSAVNVLGAASSANTGFIVDFTSRVAGMAAAAGISQTDVMGIASALSQAGVEGQVASGVFSQFVTKMFTDTAKFAHAAGLDVDQFTTLLKTDANQAILTFLDAMQQRGGFDQLAPMLKELGMQGTQAIPVLTAMAGKLTELEQAQQTAAEAYEEGTSIIEEFDNANSSAAARLDMARKGMNDAAADLGRELMPVVEQSLGATTSLLSTLGTLFSFLASHSSTLIPLAASIAAYSVAIDLAGVKTALYTKLTKLATAAQALFNTVTKLNPVGLMVAALTAAAVAFVRYRDRVAGAESVMEALKVAGGAVLDLLKGLARVVLLPVKGLIMLAEKLAGVRSATGSLANMIAFAVRAIGNTLQSLADGLNGMADMVVGALTFDWDKVKAGFVKGLKGFGEVALLNIANFRKALSDTAGTSDAAAAGAKIGAAAFGAAVKAKQSTIESETDDDNSSHDDNTRHASGTKSKAAGDGDKYKEAVDAAAHLRKQLELEWGRMLERQEISEDEYHRRLYLAEQQYLGAKLALQRQYGQSEADQTATEQEQLDSLIAEANRQRQQQLRQLNDQLAALEADHNVDMLTLTRQLFDGTIETQADYDRRRLEAERDYLSRRLDMIRAAGADTAEAELALARAEMNLTTSAAERRQKELEEQLRKGRNADGSRMSQADRLDLVEQNAELLGWQRKEQMKTDILREAEEERTRIREQATAQAEQLLQSASQLFTALQQREVSAVEQRYKRQIDQAKKAGRSTEKLEEQLEQEKLAVKKKWAERSFRLQVLQIVANTAQSISKTAAELGFPQAIPFIAVASAIGAAQLAVAKAQADEAEGLYEGGYSDDYEKGGYTCKGDPRRQAGVIPVHSGEFVANHKAVENKAVRPVLDVIDRHQRMGDIRMLDATRLLSEAYGPGRLAGGYDTPATSAAPAPLTSSADSREAVELLRQMAEGLSRSITLKDLRRQISHEEHLERNAHRDP